MADLGIIMVYIGERKNLRGAQRRVGNVGNIHDNPEMIKRR